MTDTTETQDAAPSSTEPETPQAIPQVAPNYLQDSQKLYSLSLITDVLGKLKELGHDISQHLEDVVEKVKAELKKI